MDMEIIVLSIAPPQKLEGVEKTEVLYISGRSSGRSQIQLAKTTKITWFAPRCSSSYPPVIFLLHMKIRAVPEKAR